MRTSCLGCGVLIEAGRRGRCQSCLAVARRPYEQKRAQSQARKARPYFTAEWRRARAVALSRSKSCARCGTGDDLLVHHIVPVSQGGGHDQPNLLVVCRRCHPTVEAAGR
jgi:5-methylcytosine-specific restriction protein A